MGGDEVQKKYSRKGKLDGKIHAPQLTLKNMQLENSPTPPITLCVKTFKYWLLLTFMSYCVLFCILNWKESTNKWSPNTASQNDEKPHTAELDDTAIPHVKIKITEIPQEKKLNTTIP